MSCQFRKKGSKAKGQAGNAIEKTWGWGLKEAGNNYQDGGGGGKRGMHCVTTNGPPYSKKRTARSLTDPSRTREPSGPGTKLKS